MRFNGNNLAEILVAHAAWLCRKPKGSRANLSGANLTGANFSGADLDRGKEENSPRELDHPSLEEKENGA